MLVHYHNDFILHLTPAPPAGVDFIGKIFVAGEPSRFFAFSRSGKYLVRCSVDDVSDTLKVAMCGHGLTPGRLVCNINYKIKDPEFPAGIRHLCLTDQLGVELVRQTDHNNASVFAEITPPVIDQSDDEPVEGIPLSHDEIDEAIDAVSAS